ncbi:PadR family transcriptional regulator [Lacrimispora indolis]|uniref:PadR family transcriptional regulator n=1 Tax=Lacrimispora indolis TaxID=69825 RepID=UPI0003F980E9|nr:MULTISPECIES: PadR family transcriptional regulator [Lachnospiraceae]MBE7718437.1 PadR family transcriptional regulator [Lacrimispora celerecrescens]
MTENEQFQSYITELRRGSLTLAVLGCLHQSHYGYALLQEMQGKHIDIEANTLYPLLRRLESQGLLVSDWDTSESRPRKYYIINEKGKTIYKDLISEWRRMQESFESIIGKEEHNE